MLKYRLTGYINNYGHLTQDADSCLAISERKDFYNGGDNLVFAEFFEENLENKQVSISYFIAEEETPREELEEQYLKKITGLVEASIYPVYSDVTGYLWTNEECKVGGHDLYEELQSYEGKYIDMAIEVLEKED